MQHIRAAKRQVQKFWCFVARHCARRPNEHVPTNDLVGLTHRLGTVEAMLITVQSEALEDSNQLRQKLLVTEEQISALVLKLTTYTKTLTDTHAAMQCSVDMQWEKLKTFSKRLEGLDLAAREHVSLAKTMEHKQKHMLTQLELMQMRIDQWEHKDHVIVIEDKI